jgi:hypothetical protein
MKSQCFCIWVRYTISITEMSFALARQSKTNKMVEGKMSTPAKHHSSIYPHRINNFNRDSPDYFLHLQQTIGNQTVQRLISSNNVGFDFAKIGILQPKLKVSQPGDAYEQEADKIAEQVVRMSDSFDSVTLIAATNGEEGVDRKCEACIMKKEEEKLEISLKPSATFSSETNDETANEINSLRSTGGSSLDPSIKGFMEQKFGFDFSNVRIHSDERATRSARSINALAYTIGNEIVFGEAQYRPFTFEGKRLLAHELTHVVQQTSPKNNDNDNEQYQSLHSYGTIKNAEEDAGIYRYSTQNCEKSDVTSDIDPADLRATQMAIHSAGQLARFLSIPSDPHVRDLLLKNFNDDKLSTIREVYAHFKKIEAELLGSDYQYECEDDCDSENAYVYPFWTDIHLCMNKLKGRPTDFIAGVIVHEMSHYAADTGDHEYFYPGTGVTSLSEDEAIDNADSYEGFAARL